MANIMRELEMTPDEHFEALEQQAKKLEDNFLTIGRLLADIKRQKLFLFKGYKNFKEFIENEYKMSNSLASKLIGINEVFVNQLSVDEATIHAIGSDKLHMIKPMLKDASVDEQDHWLDKAKSMPSADLREEIKDIRKKQKDKSLKEVFSDQFKEKFVTFFNCNAKEFMFKLALFFHDADLEEVKTKVRAMQRKFEENEL